MRFSSPFSGFAKPRCFFLHRGNSCGTAFFLHRAINNSLLGHMFSLFFLLIRYVSHPDGCFVQGHKSEYQT